MRVIALIPIEIIKNVQEYTKEEDVSDSLIKALSDWLIIKRIQKSNSTKEPLKFVDG